MTCPQNQKSSNELGPKWTLLDACAASNSTCSSLKRDELSHSGLMNVESGYAHDSMDF